MTVYTVLLVAFVMLHVAVFDSGEFGDRLAVLIVMMYVTGGQLELVVGGGLHISCTEFTDTSHDVTLTTAFGAAVVCNIL